MTTEEFGKLGFPSAGDMAAMFKFYISGKAVRDINLTRKLNPGLSTFEEWVVAKKDDLQKVLQ